MKDGAVPCERFPQLQLQLQLQPVPPQSAVAASLERAEGEERGREDGRTGGREERLKQRAWVMNTHRGNGRR